MAVNAANGYSTCETGALVSGDYEFQLSLNGVDQGAYNFRISDESRLMRMVTYGRVAQWVQGGVRPDADSNVFAGPYSSVGLYIEFSEAHANQDVIAVRMYRGDTLVSSCRDQILTSVSGDYTCQMQNVAAGAYEFRVFINEVVGARYPLTIEDKSGDVYGAPLPGPGVDQRAAVTFALNDPVWERSPASTRIARYYPGRALDRGVGGRVVLDCIAQYDGRLSCSIAEEEPRNLGFGDAAVRASREFRLSPRTSDGRSVAGGTLRIPIVFRVG